jgi:hypothetical protein
VAVQQHEIGTAFEALTGGLSRVPRPVSEADDHRQRQQGRKETSQLNLRAGIISSAGKNSL